MIFHSGKRREGVLLGLSQKIGHYDISQWVGKGRGFVGGYQGRLVIITFHSG